MAHVHQSSQGIRQNFRHTCCSMDTAIDKSEAARTAKYNQEMAQRMDWSGQNIYEYNYDRGIYSHEILPGLFCGTMPRNTSDLDYLHYHEGIDTVLNLQENACFHHWNVDFHSIYHRGIAHGMDIVRRPAVDFDPDSLRKVMPSAVKVVREALAANKRVYVHCTAGLGRAPAVCIAYVYWFGDHHGMTMDLDDAYKFVTDIRPCGPKKVAVRGATFDLMDDRQFHEFSGLPEQSFASINEHDRAKIQERVLQWHD